MPPVVSSAGNVKINVRRVFPFGNICRTWRNFSGNNHSCGFVLLKEKTRSTAGEKRSDMPFSPGD
jgi:hypothetical protein